MAKEYGFQHVKHHWECGMCGKKVQGAHGDVFSPPFCCGAKMKCVDGEI